MWVRVVKKTVSTRIPNTALSLVKTFWTLAPSGILAAYYMKQHTSSTEKGMPLYSVQEQCQCLEFTDWLGSKTKS